MEPFEKIKQEYSEKLGFSNWDELIISEREYVNDLNEHINNVAELYADEILKEYHN